MVLQVWRSVCLAMMTKVARPKRAAVTSASIRAGIRFIDRLLSFTQSLVAFRLFSVGPSLRVCIGLRLWFVCLPFARIGRKIIPLQTPFPRLLDRVDKRPFEFYPAWICDRPSFPTIQT